MKQGRNINLHIAIFAKQMEKNLQYSLLIFYKHSKKKMQIRCIQGSTGEKANRLSKAHGDRIADGWDLSARTLRGQNHKCFYVLCLSHQPS